MINWKGSPHFDFAISYAGSEKHIAKALADELSSLGATVFYDRFYESMLVGRRLDNEFDSIFSIGTKYFIPIISESYRNSQWPQYEWEVALTEANNRDSEFILPVRYDKTRLSGLSPNIKYLDLQNQSVQEIAEILIEKAGSSWRNIIHWVAAIGLVIEDVLNSDDFPIDAPTNYPHLCDWLNIDLMTRIKSAPISKIRFVEDLRDGEAFTLRFEFEWNPRESPLDFGDLGWWEVLEILPYNEVYGPEDAI